MTTGEKIRKYRKERGFTQIELSSKANLSRSYVADIENSRYNPSIDALQRLADVLCVPVSAIVGDASLLELVASDNGLRNAAELIRAGKEVDLSEAKQRLIDSVYAMSDEQVDALQSVVDQIIKKR